MNQTNLQMCLEESHRIESQYIDLNDVTHCDLETKSILKPAKVRAPLQEVDFGNDNNIDFDVVRKRRVSFAGVNKIKEFNSKAESVIICSTPAYEETFSTSSDSSALTASVQTNGTKEEDCTLLNDTMDLTGTMSEADEGDMMDMTSVSKAQPPPPIKGKEENPKNSENIDPNCRRPLELPKMPAELNFIGLGSETGVNHIRAPIPDPVKNLVKELLEDSTNDISVDMSLAGNNPVLHSRHSGLRDTAQPVLGEKLFGSYNPSQGKASGLGGGSDHPKKKDSDCRGMRNVFDSSFEKLIQMPVSDSAPEKRPSSHVPDFQNSSFSCMEFTEAIKNKIDIPDPQQRVQSNVDLENKAPLANAVEDCDVSMSDGLKSQMEFTEVLPKPFPARNNFNIFDPLSFKVPLNNAQSSNLLDMSQSMDFTDILRPQVIQSNDVERHQPMTAPFPKFHNGVSQENHPLFVESNVPLNVENKFGQKFLESSQMEITEALPNFLKQKGEKNNPSTQFKSGQIADSIPGDSFCMEFTEAIPNKGFNVNTCSNKDSLLRQPVASSMQNIFNTGNNLLDPKRCNDKVVQENTELQSRTKQDNNLRTVGSNPDKGEANRNMDLTQMDFTEAVPSQVPQFMKFPAFGGNIMNTSCMSLENSLAHNDEPMECTEAIPSNKFNLNAVTNNVQDLSSLDFTEAVPQRPINICVPPFVDKPGNECPFTEDVPTDRNPGNSSSVPSPGKTCRTNEMEFTQVIRGQPWRSVESMPSKGEQGNNNRPVTTESKGPVNTSRSIPSPSKTFAMNDMEFTEALPQQPLSCYVSVRSKVELETENRPTPNISKESNIPKDPVPSSCPVPSPSKTFTMNDMEFTVAVPQQPLSCIVSVQSKVELATENRPVHNISKELDFTEDPVPPSRPVPSPSKTFTMNDMEFTEALPQQPLSCFVSVRSKVDLEIKNRPMHNIPKELNLIEDQVPSSHLVPSPGKTFTMNDMEFTESLPQQPFSCLASLQSKAELVTENRPTPNIPKESNIPKDPVPSSCPVPSPSKTFTMNDMEFTEALPQQPFDCFVSARSKGELETENRPTHNIPKDPASSSRPVPSLSKTFTINDMEFTEALPGQPFNCFVPTQSKGVLEIENRPVQNIPKESNIPKDPACSSHPLPSPGKSFTVNDMEFTEALPQPFGYFVTMQPKGELETENRPTHKVARDILTNPDSSSHPDPSPSKTNRMNEMEFTEALPQQPLNCLISATSENELVTASTPIYSIAKETDVPKYPDSSSNTLPTTNKTNRMTEMEFTEVLPQQPLNFVSASSKDNLETESRPMYNIAKEIDVPKYPDGSSNTLPTTNKTNKINDLECTEANTHQPLNCVVSVSSEGDLETQNRLVTENFQQLDAPKCSEINTHSDLSPGKTVVELIEARPLQPSYSASVPSKDDVSMENIPVLGITDQPEHPDISSRAAPSPSRTNRSKDTEMDPPHGKNLAVPESSANEEGLKVIAPNNYVDHTSVKDLSNSLSSKEQKRKPNLVHREATSNTKLERISKADRSLIRSTPIKDRKTPQAINSKIPLAKRKLSSKDISFEFESKKIAAPGGVNVSMDWNQESGISQMDITGATEKNTFPLPEKQDTGPFSRHGHNLFQPPMQPKQSSENGKEWIKPDDITSTSVSSKALKNDSGVDLNSVRSSVNYSSLLSQEKLLVRKSTVKDVRRISQGVSQKESNFVNRGQDHLLSIVDNHMNLRCSVDSENKLNKKPLNGVNKIQQPIYERKGEEEWQTLKRNRIFMESIKFSFVSQTIWRRSLPWPLDIHLHLPTGDIDFSTKKKDIKLVPSKKEGDDIDQLTDRLMRKNMNLILAEDWLNSQCPSIKDLLIAIKLIEEEYCYLDPLVRSLKRLKQFFHFTIKDFRIQCKLVNLKRLSFVEMEINVTNYKKISGKDIAVTNHRGGIRPEEVQKLFDDLVVNDNRFVNFFRAINQLLASC